MYQVYKSRHIPLYDYFIALQREWICTNLRTLFYERREDLSHFEKVLNKKNHKIMQISFNEKIDSIFTHEGLRRVLENEILLDYGLPRFIYNERSQPDEVKRQRRFPYSGTTVKVYDDEWEKFGVCDYVDFKREIVYVQFDPKTKSKPFNYKQVKRLSLSETDRYYYYKEGAEVVVKGEDLEEGIISKHHFDKGTLEITMGDRLLLKKIENVSRVNVRRMD